MQALRQVQLSQEPEALLRVRLPRRENEEVRMAEQDGHGDEEEVRISQQKRISNSTLNAFLLNDRVC